MSVVNTLSSETRKRKPRIAKWIDISLKIAVVLAVLTMVRIMVFAFVLPMWRGKLTCTHPVADIGLVSQNEPMAHTFTLFNSGGGPLEVSKVLVDCRCISVADSKLPRRILKGESFTVSARIDLKEISGAFEKRLFVVSDDVRHPRVALTFKGAAIQEDAPGSLNTQ